MAGILEGVDKRTQLVGENRLELLMFRLAGRQLYGINVFKVQEVIRCPRLTHVPNGSRLVRGIANMRGRTIPVLDLGLALGQPALKSVNDAYVIITDYNRSVQGFLVQGVERIVNMNWQEILPPPKGSGAQSYMTAVTRVDEKLVEIIDVEKVLAEVIGRVDAVSAGVIQDAERQTEVTVLVADDSNVARKQIQRTLEQVGLQSIMVKDGKEALAQLKAWVDEDPDISNRIRLLISDIEMPNMDGYTLTTEIRKDPRLAGLYVMLHTSLSGNFNQAMVDKVGANRFIAKFNADELAKAILDVISNNAPARLAV